MRTRSRIYNAMVTGALSAGVLALLPGTAHGVHREGWVDCTDSTTAGVGGDESVSSDDPQPLCHGVPDFGTGYAGSGGDEGGDVAAESGGTHDDGDVRVAGCGRGAGGATAGDSAGSTGALRPDSSTADIDTSAADVGGFGTMTFTGSAGAWRRSGLQTAALAVGCPRPDAAIGGRGDGFTAPNRIDAGAGAMAATSSSAPALFSGGAVMLGAGLAARRRRTKKHEKVTVSRRGDPAYAAATAEQLRGGFVMCLTVSATPALLVRRVVIVMFLVGIAMFAAAPANADHLSGCVDTSGADVGDQMDNDTPIACPESGGPVPNIAGDGGGGGTGAAGDDVPTRIDAGAGGAAAAANPTAVGAALAGAASAGVAWLAALRRRRD